MQFKTAAALAGLLLFAPAESEGTHMQMLVYQAGNAFNTQLGSFGLYKGAEFVEYECDGSLCVKREYQLGIRKSRYVEIITKKDRPADMPGGHVTKTKPKLLTLNCKMNVARAEGFSSREDAKEWVKYMHWYLESNGMLDGCTVRL